MRILAARAALLAAVVGAGGCKKPLPPSPAPLEVEALGCVTVHQGGVRLCERRAGKLRVLVKARKVTVFSDGAPVAVTRLADAAGEQLIEVDAAVGSSELRLTSDEPPTAATATFRLTWPTRAKLDQALTLREQGDTTRASELLRDLMAHGDAAERALARGQYARIALGQGRVEEALSGLRTSVAEHRALGRTSDEVDDGLALCFALVQRSRGYSEARQRLNELAKTAALVPEGRARLPYYRGVLEAELGDRRSAIVHFAEARELAKRFQLPRLTRNATSAHALELQMLGRFREADAALTSLLLEAEASGAPPCEKVEIATNLGYGALREAEAQLGASGATLAASRLLETARSSFERARIEGDAGKCADPHLVAIALGNLAFAHYRAGHVEQARAGLRDARVHLAAPRGSEEVFWLELDALLVAEEKGKDALGRAGELLQRAGEMARSLGLPERQWSALVASATLDLRAGSPARAETSLVAAEALLDELALLVPLDTGRGTFLRDRGESMRLLMDARLARGDAAGALDVGRHARARILAQVSRALRQSRLADDERARYERAIAAYRTFREEAEAARGADWKLSKESLARVLAERGERERRWRAVIDETLAALGKRPVARAPLPDDPPTMYVHTARAEAVLLLAAQGRVTATRLAGAAPPELATALGRELERRLPKDATALRVLAAPPGIDLGALPYHGAVLGERIAFEHSLDLADAGPLGVRPLAGPKAAVKSSTDDRVLVVADPLGDLPLAAQEGRVVAERLGGRATLLVGPMGTVARVQSELGRHDLLYFAGHAVLAGHEGWDSHLKLAGGGRLDLADLLTLPRPPRRVVLTSCEAAQSVDLGGLGGFGIAQALVLAGAEAVLGPVRPITDKSAAALGARLTEGFFRGPPLAAGEVVRRAVLDGPPDDAVFASERWALQAIGP